MTAVGAQYRAVDEARGAREQEDDDVGDLLRRPPARVGDLAALEDGVLGPLEVEPLLVGQRLRAVAPHARERVAGDDPVDAHAVGGQLVREVGGQREQARVAHRRHPGAGDDHLRGDARDVDHGGAVTGAQVGQRVAHHAQPRGDLGVETLVQRLVRQLEHRAAAEAPGVVDDRVEAPEGGGRVRHEGGDGRVVAHVGGEAGRPVAELRGDRADRRLVAAADRHPRALGDQRPRDGESDPAAGAGDEDGASDEVELHRGAMFAQRTIVRARLRPVTDTASALPEGASERLELGSGSIHVQRGGEGPPLLFLHAAGGAGAWHPFLGLLARRFAVVAPDHPGFGGSDDLPEVEAMDDLVYHYLDVLDRLGLERVHVVGGSLGGWLAAELAVHSPERIERLALLGAAGLRVPGNMATDIFLMTPDQVVTTLFHDPAAAAGMFPEEPDVDFILATYRDQAGLARYGWAPYLNNPKLERRLHRITAPTRCSACLNSCANFETVGGHAFGGETYSGGIGGSWEAGTGTLMNARFSELCTACSRCVPNCPVRIDIPWLNENLRQRMNQAQGSSPAKFLFGEVTGSAPADSVAPLQKQFFGNYNTFGKWGSRFASLANASLHVPGARSVMQSVFGVDSRRDLPAFPGKTWEQLYHEEKNVKQGTLQPRVVMLADIFTNYGSPERGMAAIRVLRAIGLDVVLSPAMPDGRAAMSQGMMETAAKQARAIAPMLRRYVDEGRKIVVLEPSVLAMLRFDFRHLLDGDGTHALLAQNSFEPLEYLWLVAQEQKLDLARIFSASRCPQGARLFYHSHCQQRTCNSATQTIEVLRAAGFDVVTSSVECCGMAGSFGYKREYYDLSMAVGEDLFAQVRRAEQESGPRTLVASGTSCHEQLLAGMGREVFHPAELLASAIQ